MHRYHYPPALTTDWLARPLLTTLALIAIQFGASGCVHQPLLNEETTKEETPDQVQEIKAPLPMVPQEAFPPKSKRWEWQGDDRRITHIWIDLDSQKARFYEGTKQIGWTYVASGLASHPTPIGRFSVAGKEKTKKSNLYGKIYNAQGRVVINDAKFGKDRIPKGGRFEGAKMPYFLRLTNDGVGLHAGPIPRPGRPASHGCIRMPEPLASRLFSQVPIGTPVTITGSGPDYSEYKTMLAAKGPKQMEPAEGGTIQSPAETQNHPPRVQPQNTRLDLALPISTPSLNPNQSPLPTHQAPSPLDQQIQASTPISPRQTQPGPHQNLSSGDQDQSSQTDPIPDTATANSAETPASATALTAQGTAVTPEAEQRSPAPTPKPEQGSTSALAEAATAVESPQTQPQPTQAMPITTASQPMEGPEPEVPASVPSQAAPPPAESVQATQVGTPAG